MSFVTYVPVVATSDVAPGTMREVDMDGRTIVVANVDGEYFAFQPDCPHNGVKLAMGLLAGKAVVCPNHNYHFDLQTGQLVHPAGGCEDLTVYTVEPRDGMVCLKIEI
jgi:3-phenylpropionate/trans-cinnamate dioxygenase ferredoxin subunit